MDLQDFKNLNEAYDRLVEAQKLVEQVRGKQLSRDDKATLDTCLAAIGEAEEQIA